MFFHYRRNWILITAVLFLLPSVTGLFFPKTIRTSDELRTPVAAPPMPQGWLEWLTLPSRLDPYLRDNFGLRRPLIRWHARLSQLLASGNKSVLAGNQQLFYRGDNAIEQSAGLMVREAQVEQTAAVIADVNALLKARGIMLIFGSPPNSSSMYEDLLPTWARRGGRTTEYDLLFAALRARGVKTVDFLHDLRVAEKTKRTYYRYDTHWNAFGALVAYNALVSAMGKDSWRLDGASLLEPGTARKDRDLARMLGLGNDLSEDVPTLRLPKPDRTPIADATPTLAFVPFVTTPERPDGPTIMILGDSFSPDDLTTLAATHARRVVWFHHGSCDFEWKWIDQFKPQVIWWIPTERAMLCRNGVRPQGMPNERS